MKRFFELLLAILLIISLIILMLGIAIVIKLTSKGPVLYWSDRVGVDNKIFKMPKFRSMRIGTPSLASHLMADPASFVTPVGAFLRRLSLDELPQLYSILTGDMSFVGPRPALFNQEDLIKLRADNGILSLKPGITGWAQVNGRDDLSIIKKVDFEKEYLEKRSLPFDLYIIWLTLKKVIYRDGVSH